MQVDEAGQNGMIIIKCDVTVRVNAITTLTHCYDSAPLYKNAGIFDSLLIHTIKRNAFKIKGYTHGRKTLWPAIPPGSV
ncbi:hypothetical protein [Natronospira proteinivora]|uniref:hypothetical protein n=1 Tax=Natronospira proteinivora TaxID=1807133 RepID=UPI00209F05EA|nr:hypothetical protein [Natronospira proteinivora]